ncbi:MAG: response regulator, partial [Candidatus Zixiibacteriota bacterium]
MTSSPRPQKILIAEKDKSIRDTLVEYFKHAGYEAYGVCERQDIVARAVGEGCSVVVLDYHLSSGQHPEILDELLQADAAICVVLLTSYALVELVIDAYRRGAFDVVPKPLDLFELGEVVERAFAQHELNMIHAFVRQNMNRIR